MQISTSLAAARLRSSVALLQQLLEAAPQGGLPLETYRCLRNSALPVNQIQRWKPIHPIDRRHFRVGINDARFQTGNSAEKSRNALCRGCRIISVRRHQDQALRSELCLQSQKRRHFLDARLTPRGPEVQQDDFAAQLLQLEISA